MVGTPLSQDLTSAVLILNERDSVLTSLTFPLSGANKPQNLPTAPATVPATAPEEERGEGMPRKSTREKKGKFTDNFYVYVT